MQARKRKRVNHCKVSSKWENTLVTNRREYTSMIMHAQTLNHVYPQVTQPVKRKKMQPENNSAKVQCFE